MLLFSLLFLSVAVHTMQAGVFHMDDCPSEFESEGSSCSGSSSASCSPVKPSSPSSAAVAVRERSIDDFYGQYHAPYDDFGIIMKRGNAAARERKKNPDFKSSHRTDVYAAAVPKTASNEQKTTSAFSFASAATEAATPAVTPGSKENAAATQSGDLDLEELEIARLTQSGALELLFKSPELSGRTASKYSHVERTPQPKLPQGSRSRSIAEAIRAGTIDGLILRSHAERDDL